MLSNDRRTLDKHIAQLLEGAIPRKGPGEPVAPRAQPACAPPPRAYKPLFVRTVAPGSPAAAAVRTDSLTQGLLAGDEIRRFGDIEHVTSDSLSLIPSQVRAGAAFPVEVARMTTRGYELATLELRPMQWSGRGLLGCQIVP